MVRGLSAAQLYELRVFEEMYPSGEDRMDRRFGVLASALVGAAGATFKDGSQYTTDHFLKSLRMQLDEWGASPPAPPQTLAFQIDVIETWCEAHNQAFREAHGIAA